MSLPNKVKLLAADFQNVFIILIDLVLPFLTGYVT